MTDEEFQEEFGMTIAEFDDYVENGDWFIEGEK
jgi:hypothetical protein